MAPAGLIILSVLVVDFEAAVAVETKTEVMDSVKIETNSVGPADTYSLYKQMMEMKQHLLSNSSSADKPDSEPARDLNKTEKCPQLTVRRHR